jgi:hypothetical protein
MPGQQRRQQVSVRPRGKSPAERSEEFDAKQAQLKADAAERREAAKDSPPRNKRRGRDA